MASGSRHEGDVARACGVVAVDVGNTVTSVGVFATGAQAHDDPVLRWDLSTPRSLTADEAFLTLASLPGVGEGEGRAVGASILSCVVPTHAQAWQGALARLSATRPLVVGPGLRTGLKMRYRDPAEIGPDRIADAVATRERYELPAVAIDFGTTVNMEVIGRDGTFLGGLIAPGIALGARSLSEWAARLPLIRLEVPREVIGRSTREAMLSGVVLGEAARLDGLIDLICKELGERATVVMTGERAAQMAALVSHEATVDATLTLRGLHQLCLQNRRG